MRWTWEPGDRDIPALELCYVTSVRACFVSETDMRARGYRYQDPRVVFRHLARLCFSPEMNMIIRRRIYCPYRSVFRHLIRLCLVPETDMRTKWYRHHRSRAVFCQLVDLCCLSEKGMSTRIFVSLQIHAFWLATGIENRKYESCCISSFLSEVHTVTVSVCMANQ